MLQIMISRVKISLAENDKSTYVSISWGISSKSSKVLWFASNFWFIFLFSKISSADSTNSVHPDVNFGTSAIYKGKVSYFSWAESIIFHKAHLHVRKAYMRLLQLIINLNIFYIPKHYTAISPFITRIRLNHSSILFTVCTACTSTHVHLSYLIPHPNLELHVSSWKFVNIQGPTKTLRKWYI